MPDDLQLNCHLAYLGAVPTDIVPPAGPSVPCIGGVSRELPDLFLNSSFGHAQLTLNTTRLQASPEDPTRQTVTTADLNSFTSRLIGTPPNATSQKLTDITVIYAPELQGYPEIRGLMFNTGFEPDTKDDNNWAQWSGCPRTGCAVFLKSIQNSRPKAEVLNQIAYTTVHELGHVFNLLHTDDLCFMHPSPDDVSPPNDWYQFNQDNQVFLSHCNEVAFYPGGNQFGDHTYMGSGDVRTAHAKGKAPLKLKIQVSRDEFLPFEPVELDVKLSLVKGAARPRKLRDELDPSYSNFTIWIEEPGGERRRYRSINHCCSNPMPCKVKPGEPFERDITLFGQSGGYTFRRAGVHRVWITWRQSPRVVLKSNVIELTVRPTLKLTTKEEQLCRVLRKAGRPLFYRRRLWERHENDALASLCSDFKGKAHRYAMTMAMHARWCIQRDIARHNTSYRKQHHKRLRERGAWLRDQELLGAHRCEKVERVLEEM